jgi:hypothetical protein
MPLETPLGLDNQSDWPSQASASERVQLWTGTIHTGENTGDPWQKMVAIGSTWAVPREAHKWLIRVAHRQPQSSVEMGSPATVNRGVVGSSPT